MRAVIFIGDELSATGFRLTGIEALTPEFDAAAAAFQDARTRAGLVIITAEFARHVPAADLEAAMLAEVPAVAIIPDVLFRSPVPDLAKRLRSTMGLET
jgi:vacuolar-type H+-ATPase subunit F/Vma7